MAARKKPLDVAIDVSLNLPEFPDEDTAHAWFESLREVNLSRLRSIVEPLGIDSTSESPESLKAIDEWVSGLGNEILANLDTSAAELDYLVHWYAADVVVRHVPHARRIVKESDFVAGRWEVAIRLGSGTWCLPVDAPARPISRQESNRRGAPRFAWYQALCSAHASDPRLHPAVLANSHRLSDDPSLCSCQTIVLSRGVDAFDEAQLLAALVNPRDPSTDSRLKGRRAKTRVWLDASIQDFWRIALVRCLESPLTFGPASTAFLRQMAENQSDAHRHLALDVVLIRDPEKALTMALRHLDYFDRFVPEHTLARFVAMRDPRVVPILEAVVERVSERKQSLWQSAEAFAIALGALWNWARKGNVEAQAALRIVARRWGRFCDETHDAVSRHAPGLTPQIARSGGLAPK